MHGKTITATDQTFEQQVLHADKLVLVDFGDPWCPPCRAISQALEAVADDYPDDIMLVQVNTLENPRLAAEYTIMALPTIIVFMDGQAIDRVEGARPKSFYAARLKQLLREPMRVQQ